MNGGGEKRDEYLFHDFLNCRGVRCVQQLPNEQRLDSSPHDARQGIGLQVLDHAFTVWGWEEPHSTRVR